MFEQLCLVDRSVATVLRVTVQVGRPTPWLAPDAPAQHQAFALRLWLVDSHGRIFRRTVRVKRTGAFPTRPAVLGWRWAPAATGTAVTVQLGGAPGAQPRLTLADHGRTLYLGSVALPELVGDATAQLDPCRAEPLPGVALLRASLRVEGYVHAGPDLQLLTRTLDVQAEVQVPGLLPTDELRVAARVAGVQRVGLPGQVMVTVRFGGWALRPTLARGDGGLWLGYPVLAPLSVEEHVQVDLAGVAPAVTWIRGEADLSQPARRLLYARAGLDRWRRVLVEVVTRVEEGPRYHRLHLPGTGLAAADRVAALELRLSPGGTRLAVAAALISS